MIYSDSKLISEIRNKCVICDSENIKDLIKIEDFPIFMGCSELTVENDIFCDQEWIICENCGCVQLGKLIEPSILYSASHLSGAIGETWIRHHEEFAKFINRWFPKSICEIGAAHGYLAKTILNSNSLIRYMIIEPNPTHFDSRIQYFEGFIEQKPHLISDFDHILHSHVLEHVYSPKKFLQTIRDHMKPNALVHFSIPNIERLIEIKGTNSLNFEHTYYLHISQLKIVLQNLGFRIIELKKFMEHSYFLTIKKDLATEPQQIVNIKKEGLLFEEMMNEVKIFSHKVSQIIEDNELEVFLFGAHVFSQSIYHSIKSDKKYSLSVLDNAKEKQGKRLYGTNMNVHGPEYVRDKKNIAVVLRASHYQNEIKKQLIEINPQIRIIE